jgi:type IV pilus assembly protein PilW
MMTAPLFMRRGTQQGLTLIELMVAVAISLLLMAAFIAAMVNMKSSFVTQDALAQLQDNERLSVTILTNTVHAAGYVSDPKNNLASDAFPASTGATTYGSFAQSQAVTGTPASAGKPESFSSRFIWADGVTDCTGQTSITGAVRTNIFTTNAANELVCSVDGGATWVALVGGVSEFVVQYGVAVGGASGINRYVRVSDMTAAMWGAVKTVRMTLRFRNPLATNVTFDSVQTITLMNQL